jgi:hypothetical protein
VDEDLYLSKESNMRTLVVVAVVLGLLTLTTLHAEDVEKKGEKKPDEKKPAVEMPAKPPAKAAYQHTTAANRLGKFELEGEKGKADYYYNGTHRKDDLVFSRSAEVTGGPGGKIPGWVYQVSKDGKKEMFWFFFGSTPLGKDGKLFAMFYTTTPPGKDGKQPWTRILTPAGTTRTISMKKAADDDEDK